MQEINSLKGQHVTSPEGPGDIIETISDKVVVELESGAACLFPVTDVILDKDENHFQQYNYKAYARHELSRPLPGSHR